MPHGFRAIKNWPGKPNRLILLLNMAHPEGFEPPTAWLAVIWANIFSINISNLRCVRFPILRNNMVHMLNSFRQNFGSRFDRIKYFSILTLRKNDTDIETIRTFN